MTIATTFSFEAELEYTDWRGRDRVCRCAVSYSYDGKSAPVCTSARPFSDDAEAEHALDSVVDDWIADQCDNDWADMFGSEELAA